MPLHLLLPPGLFFLRNDGHLDCVDEVSPEVQERGFFLESTLLISLGNWAKSQLKYLINHHLSSGTVFKISKVLNFHSEVSYLSDRTSKSIRESNGWKFGSESILWLETDQLGNDQQEESIGFT